MNLIRTVFFCLLVITFTIANAVTPKIGNSKIQNSASYVSGLDGWRFGLGFGYALYVGDQMDFVLTKNFGEFKELRTNITL